jgi:hypothetical protein
MGGTGGVKDVFDTPMAQSFQLEFTTGDADNTTTPVISNPVDRTAVGYPFTISWIGGMPPYEIQISQDAGFNKIFWNSIVVVKTADGGSVTPGELFPNDFYYARVRCSDKEWSGYIGFAVSTQQQQMFATGEGFVLLDCFPSPFAANVSTNKVILNFNKELDENTLSNIYIVKMPLDAKVVI